LNDIIETAYVVADYSYDNSSTEHDNYKRNINFGNTQTQSNMPIQQPYRFGHTSNDTFRNNGVNSGSGSGNIFLKNQQTVTNNASSMNNDKKESNKIDLNDDNFPTLGNNSKQSVEQNKPSNVGYKLDFKKMVEKKPDIVTNKPDPKIVNTHQCRKINYNQYSLYQEIKEKSEKTARLQMVNDVLSDDDNSVIGDNYY
jgi:hypothetical protein